MKLLSSLALGLLAIAWIVGLECFSSFSIDSCRVTEDRQPTVSPLECVPIWTARVATRFLFFACVSKHQSGQSSARSVSSFCIRKSGTLRLRGFNHLRRLVRAGFRNMGCH